MNQELLRGRLVLVLEDEYIVAMDLCQLLESKGAIVVGPLTSVADALDVLDDLTQVDVAVLDVNLRGSKVFPLADVLKRRSIPFLFATGMARDDFPDRFRDVPRCEKPIDLESIVAVIEAQLEQAASPA
jgi:CheY-like chemotaxis protein